MNIQTQIMNHAATEAGAIAAEAVRLLECAVRDGDELPGVVVTVKVAVTKSGGVYSIDRKAEAKRVQLEKSKGESIEWNPNQPGLPFPGETENQGD